MSCKDIKSLVKDKQMKKTVVFGASPNTSRYSNIATHRLSTAGYEVVPVGVREGMIDGINIQKGQPTLDGVDTITLYMNPQRQKEHYDYFFSLNPKRIIFNPGTENPELIQLAQEKGIETTVACTLVMLSVGDY